MKIQISVISLVLIIFLTALCSRNKFNKGDLSMNRSNYFIRRSKDRGFFDHGWLKTYHTFSFASYYDPNFMGFRSLRVINDDVIDAGRGFPTHHHDNMEIISILLKGELAHKDSMNNEEVIHENEIQVMSAGTGINHSEYNPSKTNPTHLLQIWIMPDQKSLTPSYGQRKLPQITNEWILLVSNSKEADALQINQDAKLYMATLDKDVKINKQLEANRYGWLQIIEGDVNLAGETLHTGDGVAISNGVNIELSAITKAKLLLFDLN